jgi:DNA-binding NarL/FixJ family response regulator
MANNAKGSGADYLVEKNDLAYASQSLPRIRDIVVFEDERLDSDRMLATLRTLLGYDLEVRRASTLNSGIDLLLAKLPDLLLLDDYLGHTDRADDALPLIRRAGFEGPIVVVSGALDRKRRTQLLKLGVTEAINKDDLDSGSIGRIMLQLADTIARHVPRSTTP